MIEPDSLSTIVGPTGAFAVPALESDYRREHADSDRRTARACVMVVAAGGAVFAVSDFRLFGPGDEFQALAAARIGVVVLSALVWLHLARPLAPSVLDRTVFLWGAAVVAEILYVTSTRPPTYTAHAVVNLGSVLLAYTVIPLPLVGQAVLAVCLSAGCVALAAVGDSGSGLVTAAVGWPFLGANTLGVIVSRQLHRRGREAFVARIGLERALAEVRTLRGMIRLCAWCRKVDTEGGGWQQLEAYVRDHTHAEFTHGICPSCEATARKEIV